ncbi:cell surface protein [Clostridioides difficile]|nr:cell surface protein [Clostridioides difficile]VHZ08052.1 cell surface protein [Clostridioides difficile]
MKSTLGVENNMKNSKKILAIGLTLFLVMVNTPMVNALTSVEQIKGNDRYETAAKIADKQNYNTAILINSDNSLADGLSASGLAGALNAPILMTKQNQIPNTTMERLNKAKTVYIIGSESTISKNVENQLLSKKKVVQRIFGENRFDTSIKIAEKIKEIKPIDKVIIANGFTGEADAISASPVAARDGVPIILTDGNSVGFDTTGLKSYALGSSEIISDELVKSTNSIRLGGTDRFETNKIVIQEFYKNSKEFYLSKGLQLTDALVASTIAKNAPVVLVENGSNKSILSGADKLTVLGGINQNVIKQCINQASPNQQGLYYNPNDRAFKERIKGKVYALTKQYRKDNGVRALSVASRLEGLANDWSNLMANKKTLSHTINGKNSYSTFLKYLDWSEIKPGYIAVQGENIIKYKIPDKPVYTNRDADDIGNFIFNEWKTNPEEGTNMLHKGYEIMGFGIAITGDKNLYATHEFYGRYKE